MDVGAAIAIGAVVGVVCGLAPLIFGFNKNEKGLAWGGFGVCVAGGMLLGALLALPMAILFSILIHNAAKRKAGAFDGRQTGAFNAQAPGQGYTAPGQPAQGYGAQGYAAPRPEAPRAVDRPAAQA